MVTDLVLHNKSRQVATTTGRQRKRQSQSKQHLQPVISPVVVVRDLWDIDKSSGNNSLALLVAGSEASFSPAEPVEPAEAEQLELEVIQALITHKQALVAELDQQIKRAVIEKIELVAQLETLESISAQLTQAQRQTQPIATLSPASEIECQSPHLAFTNEWIQAHKGKGTAIEATALVDGVALPNGFAPVPPPDPVATNKPVKPLQGSGQAQEQEQQPRFRTRQRGNLPSEFYI